MNLPAARGIPVALIAVRVIKALLVLLLIIPITSHAWNAMGHMLVAQIAYNELTPKAKTEVDKLSKIFATLYPKSNNFISAAPWADDIKGHDIHVFDTWHYININFSKDGSRYPKKINTPHVVWAIDEMTDILKSKHALAHEKAVALQMLSHFVGDIHQPLHAASNYSKKHPQGDAGGNEFTLPGPAANLHMLWDNGVNTFALAPRRPLTKQQAQSVAQKARALSTLYISRRDPRLKKQHAMDWAYESQRIALYKVYENITEHKRPSATYLKTNSAIAEQQIVLAGYRLARRINTIFDDK